MDSSIIIKICIWAIPVIFAISVHEWAHGYVANKLGDNTAAVLGRLSINPVRHVDLIGTIIVTVVFLVAGGFIFGWAKPVPVNTRKFSKPMQSMALVALAGPVANFIMGLLWTILVGVAVITMAISPTLSEYLKLVGIAGIQINTMLLVINLLPIPPLDGSRIFAYMLPRGGIQSAYLQVEKYGFIILIALIFTGLLHYIVNPIFSLLLGFYDSLLRLLII